MTGLVTEGESPAETLVRLGQWHGRAGGDKREAWMLGKMVASLRCVELEKPKPSETTFAWEAGPTPEALRESQGWE